MAETSTQQPSADYFISTHQFTRTVHRDRYPSIDPTSPKLSQKGQTVIVTGASQGIGKAISIAFAKAGAAKIVLVARNASNLEITQQELLKINPDISVVVIPTDTTSASSVDKLEATIKSDIGVPNVLVNSAGSWCSTESIGESKPEEWWRDFEVNVKGSYLMSRAFLKLVEPETKANIINVSSFGAWMTQPVGSSYFISKLAQTRLSEAIALAYPNVTSVSYHPGMIETNMAEQHPETRGFCNDTLELAAGTAVYLASERAGWLSGRYISANWDVDELEERKDEILGQGSLVVGLKGNFGSELFA